MIQQLPETHWDEEIPFIFLGYSLHLIQQGTEPPGTFRYVNEFDQSVTRSELQHCTKKSPVKILSDLSYHDQRNELWINNIKHYQLTNSHPLLAASV